MLVALVLAVVLVMAIVAIDRRERERQEMFHVVGAKKWWGKEEDPWRYEDFRSTKF
jgi:hypothetical protein